MTFKRKDANQSEIVQTLRSLGVTVYVTSMVGDGFPDAVVGLNGCTFLVEIKNGKKPPSQQKLTPAEQKFFDSWKGQVCIIRSVDEAVQFVNKARMGLGK